LTQLIKSLFNVTFGPIWTFLVYLGEPLEFFRKEKHYVPVAAIAILFWGAGLYRLMARMQADAVSMRSAGTRADLGALEILHTPIAADLLLALSILLSILMLFPSIWIWTNNAYRAFHDERTYFMIAALFGASYLVRTLLQIPAAVMFDPDVVPDLDTYRKIRIWRLIADVGGLMVVLTILANLRGLYPEASRLRFWAGIGVFVAIQIVVAVIYWQLILIYVRAVTSGG